MRKCWRRRRSAAARGTGAPTASYSPSDASAFSRRRRAQSATLIKHNGHKGHKGKPNGLILVSFVSFVLIQRRYADRRPIQRRSFHRDDEIAARIDIAVVDARLVRFFRQRFRSEER